MSTYVSVEISPATTTRPVVISVSHAQRAFGSSRSTASRTVSETWSAILSGCPSVTDSEVKRNSRAAIGPEEYLLDSQEGRDLDLVRARDRILHRRAQRLQVPAHGGRELRVREPLHHRDRAVDVDVEEPLRLVRHLGALLRALELAVLRERRSRVLDAPDPLRKVGKD